MPLYIRPNKKIGIVRVTGLKILGRVCTHIFLICLFSPFKMHKIIFLQENLKKIVSFTSKFRLGWVTLNTDLFYLA